MDNHFAEPEPLRAILAGLHERYPAARDELRANYGDDEPSVPWYCLDILDADLAGYVSRITRLEDRAELLQGLQATKVLDDPEIAAWVRQDGQRCPATVSYITQLETLRNAALTFLGVDQP
jgi:hypothetical protein